MLIKRSDSLLELLVSTQWIAASSADCTVKQFEQFMKVHSQERTAHYHITV